MSSHRTVTSAAIGAAALGAIEGARAAPPGHLLATLAAAIGASFVAGALLGVIEIGALRAGAAIDRRAGFGAWWARHTSTDPLAPREPVIQLASVIPGSLAGFGVFVVAFALALPRLANVEEASLRSQLTVALAAVAALVGATTGLVATLALRPLMRRLDAWKALPWPHSARARAALWLGLPVTLVAAPAMLLLRGPLFALAVGGAIALVVLAQLAMAPLGRLLSASAARNSLQLTLLGVVVAIGAADRGLAAASVAERIDGTSLPRVGALALRSVTDLDRDGASSLFGGRDCAAFDRARHPLARDVAGNGVDEDCTGSDADAADAAADLATTPAEAIAASRIQPKKRNLVWVVVDAVRADATSLLGYRRKTTPFLESLAEESLVFENAYSQSSATMLSIPSMLSGLDPAAIEWKHDGERLQLTPSNHTLSERLPKGYRSAIIVDGYIAGKLSGLTQGFDDTLSIWLDGKRDPWQDRSSMVAVTRAIEWLERDAKLGEKGSKPFLLVVYMHNPHSPYDPRPEYGADFGKKARDRYDAEVTFADRATGFLVDYLRYRRVWSNTVFVSNSDHGEEFGEHDGKTHARQCYEESTHVPLLVRIPNVPAQRVKARVALVDVVPTLLDAIGEPERGGLDGQSLLVPAFSPAARPEDRPVFCSVISQKDCRRRGGRVELGEDAGNGG